MKITGWGNPIANLRPPAGSPPRPSTGADPQLAQADQVSLQGPASDTPRRYLEKPDGSKIALPEQGAFQLGRSKECPVRLDGDLVSRNHCLGEYRNGQLWMQDVSSNGTFVNGEPLPQGQWVEIPRGAEVGFGQTVHTFRLGSDQPGSGGLQGPQGQSFEWPADQQTVKVGRSPDSHLKPLDNLVSGNHALLRKVDGKMSVLDTQSRNGTYLDGLRLEPMKWTEVPPGGRLAFGDPDLAWSSG